MSRLDPQSYDAVIFDLGGVILDLDFDATVRAFASLSGEPSSRLYSRTAQRVLFDEFERGEIDAPAFRERLRAELRPTSHVPDDELDLAWNALLGDIPSHRLELLGRLRGETRTFLLSNTNSIHIERFFLDFAERHGARVGPWSSFFEADLYSHVLGARKPEPRIFQMVSARFGLVPARTVFIDDNEHNVAAALELGFLAHHHVPGRDLDFYF